MHGVHDEKTTGEGILRLYPNGLAVASDLRGSLDLDEDVPGGVHTNEPVALLRAMIDREFDGPCNQNKKLTAS